MEVKSPEEADFILQKLPCDMGIHRNPRKGTLNGPKKILDNFQIEKKILVDEVFPNEFSLEETHERIAVNTKDLLKYEKPIISVGGDHSVSFPVIKTLKDRNPDLKVVWLDSHLDMKQKVGENTSHDVVVRELLKNGFSEDEIFFVGNTKIDEDEREFLETKNLNIFSSDEVKDFIREFELSEQPVYLSIDIDVLKKELAPGTGYPDGRLELEGLKQVIHAVDPDFADLVEVAPPLDRGGITVLNARKILRRLSAKL